MTQRKINIPAENKINLTQEQKNLIELAFIKQIPPEDAEFIRKMQKESKDELNQPFVELSRYFIDKYGMEFGIVYLAAIIGGEKQYKDAIELIKKEKTKQNI